MIDDPQAQPVPQGQARWADVAVTPAVVDGELYAIEPEVQSWDGLTVRLVPPSGETAA